MHSDRTLNFLLPMVNFEFSVYVVVTVVVGLFFILDLLHACVMQLSFFFCLITLLAEVFVRENAKYFKNNMRKKFRNSNFKLRMTKS